jgi:hypothetical protein
MLTGPRGKFGSMGGMFSNTGAAIMGASGFTKPL